MSAVQMVYKGLKLTNCKVVGSIKTITSFIPVEIYANGKKKCVVIQVKLGKRMSSRVKLPNGRVLRFEKHQGTRRK